MSTHNRIYNNRHRSASHHITINLLCLALLGRRLLRHRRRLVRIDGEQRQLHGAHREQHRVLQHHGAVVQAERVQRPGAGHQRAGEDQRQRQAVDAALAHDLALCGTDRYGEISFVVANTKSFDSDILVGLYIFTYIVRITLEIGGASKEKKTHRVLDKCFKII